MPDLRGKLDGDGGASRMLSKDDITLINRKLGRPDRAALPRCPAKTRKKLEQLDQELGHGNNFHRSISHGPCHICACSNVAGFGTIHKGWGWCYIHEKGKHRKFHAPKFAENHLVALQSRNPAFYKDQSHCTEAVVIEGQVAKENNVLKGNMLSVMKGLDKVFELFEGFKPGGSGVFDEYTKEISGSDRKLTESSRNGPIVMSDETYIKLMAGTLKTVAGAAKLIQEVDAFNAMTEDQFKEFLFDLKEGCKQTFADQQYACGNGQEKIVEGVMTVMFECLKRLRK